MEKSDSTFYTVSLFNIHEKFVGYLNMSNSDSIDDYNEAATFCSMDDCMEAFQEFNLNMLKNKMKPCQGRIVKHQAFDIDLIYKR